MPQYYARGIGVYLKRYDALTETRKAERSGIPEIPIEHDGYRTRFIGPLDDMPLFLATVGRERMDVSTPVQGLELMVDFTRAGKTCRTFDGCRDLKIEVFLNGELVACRFRAANTSPSTIEIFSGRRVGKKMERPWVLNMKPRGGLELPTEQVLRQQWSDIGHNLRKQALERGTNESGRIPYSAEYLLSLSTLSYEDCGRSSIIPSIIDVVISYGEGHKPQQVYISEPEPMRDATYDTENSGLSEDRYQTRSQLVTNTVQATAAEAHPSSIPSALRATTPPNKPINQLSLDRSPFKATFHVVRNVNKGTAMLSPERMQYLDRAKPKHSPGKQLFGETIFQAIEDATRSLKHLSAGQHIEQMQQDPSTAPIPVTPHKRRQSAAEFEKETSKVKKARPDETEASPSAVSKARQMDKFKKLQQSDQLPREIKRSQTDTPVPRFSTPASALSRFGISRKPKSQKPTVRGDVEAEGGSGASTEGGTIKRIDSAASAAVRPDHTAAGNIVKQESPVVANTRSSTSTQKQQPSAMKSHEDSVWPPQSSRGCAVTYLDAKFCGLSQEDYRKALGGDGKGIPYLSCDVKKERKGDFQEKGIVCGVRYVII